MRKILYLFLFSIVCFSQKKVGQPLIDSLLVELPKMKEDSLKVKLLINLASIYQKIDPKKGLKTSSNALVLSKKINWKDGIALTYLAFAANHMKLSEYDKALNYHKASLKSSNKRKIVFKNYNGLGNYYYNKSDFPNSLKNYNIALKIIEEIKDTKEEACILSNIGTVYDKTSDLKKAIQFYEKSYQIAKKYNYLDVAVGSLGNLGNAYGGLFDFDKAIFYQKECINVSKKIGSTSDEAIALSALGLIYCDKKEFEKGLKYSFESLKQNQKLNNENDISINYSIIGYIYHEKSRIIKNLSKQKICQNKAIEYYKKGIIVKLKTGNKVDIIYDYQAVSELNKLIGNYKASLESHEQYVIYKDSVFNSENKETIKNLEDKREIELRDKEIKINKLSLEAKEKQKWYLFGGLGLLTIIGGLLFYQSRKRKQVNSKLEVLNQTLDQANQTKTRFFNILNHDLRGPVANLIDFLQIQKDSPELLDEATKKRIQDTTLSSAENLLSSMEDILLWSKGQMANFKPQPKQIEVSKLFDDTKKVFSGYLKIKFEYQNPDNLEVFTDENYLKTIIRNLTSNAINVLAEYVTSSSVEKQIIWKAYKNNNGIFLSITDNGPGATQDQFKALYDDTEVVGIKSGLGLHLIRDLAKAIDCEITVDSKVGSGTTFILKLNK